MAAAHRRSRYPIAALALLAATALVIACDDESSGDPDIIVLDDIGDSTTPDATDTGAGNADTTSPADLTGDASDLAPDALDTADASDLADTSDMVSPPDTANPPDMVNPPDLVDASDVAVLDDATDMLPDLTDTSPDTTAPVCGNGFLEAGEGCDAPDFGGATCESEGFAGGGMLGCTTDCMDLDVSGCFVAPFCGDGTLDPGESCEGADLGGASCSSLGLGAGSLVCDANCDYDTTGCTNMPFCGNGVREGTEECDGADLGGADCVSRFHDAGTLGCTASCTFDVTMCTRGTRPTTGDVIFTEIMANPSGLPDVDGEWFELTNDSASTTFSLNGCYFRGDSQTEGFTLSGLPPMTPGARFTFAPISSTGPGFSPTFRYGNYNLVNNSDFVRLVCGSGGGGPVPIDEFAWHSAMPVGASLQLDPAHFDDAANNDRANWCDAQPTYANGDRGTPGTANHDCGVAPPPSLIFSEYVEGSSDNKALEIYNASAGSLDLSLCVLMIAFNGGTSQGVLTLNGTLAAGASHVVCHTDAAAAIQSACDQTWGSLDFNGDDALSLICNSTDAHDFFGVVGADPGTAWTGNGVSTINQTLRRKCGITVGDRVASDPFDPSAEWDELPVDTFDGLGTHSPSCP